MYKNIVCILLIFCSTVVLGGTIDPKNSDQAHLDYGAKHECVLKIIGFHTDKLTTPFSGSCVVIDKYHVLTAAHVVSNSMLVGILHKNDVHTCDIIAIHADFNPNEFGKNDIALIRLKTPIELDFYPDLYTERDEANKICSLAGYGFTGTFSTGFHKKYDGKKRAGSNRVSKIDDNILICDTMDSKTSLEFLICNGDSGGGLFIDQKLAGINSCVFSRDGKTDSDYGDTSGHTRISDYISWISNVKNAMDTVFKSNDL